jgi:hypothetical protein
MEAAVSSHFGWLLENMHQARTEERQYLAREPHDRVSTGIGVAFRQLELSEMQLALSEMWQGTDALQASTGSRRGTP